MTPRSFHQDVIVDDLCSQEKTSSEGFSLSSIELMTEDLRTEANFAHQLVAEPFGVVKSSSTNPLVVEFYFSIFRFYHAKL